MDELSTADGTGGASSDDGGVGRKDAGTTAGKDVESMAEEDEESTAGEDEGTAGGYDVDEGNADGSTVGGELGETHPADVGTAVEETTDEATEATLRRVRFVSRLMDNAVRIPGTNRRIGIDPVLSILPVGGDAAGLVLSLYPIAEAARLGVPKRVLARMLLNVGVDAGFGSVPVLGTIFDAFWKANERNVDLLERHLAQRG